MSIKTGDTVNYHAVIGGEVTSTDHTVKSIELAPDNYGEDVAWITNKSGCVALAALSLAEQSSKALCIYHDNCADGFAAAWVVREAIEGISFIPAKYQESPPDVTGLEVIIVDFSYKRDVLIEMAKTATSILILDHHKSAKEELVDLPDNVTAILDMEKSGAILAWEYFHKDTSPPPLFLHIQDRDLWRFELDGTKKITAALFSYPFTFDAWDNLPSDVNELLLEGEVILRKHLKDVNQLIESYSYFDVIDGHTVPILNAPGFYASDAGHIMGEGQPFAATYQDNGTLRTFSLRSSEDGLDVSEIAVRFGGGGHKHAAGFSLPLAHLSCLAD